jgi:L-lactate dehydrogenase complex protein LldG
MVQKEQKKMSSRSNILERVKLNQPGTEAPYVYHITPVSAKDATEKFKNTLTSIGGVVLEIEDVKDVNEFLIHTFPLAKEVISSFASITNNLLIRDADQDPHELKNVDVAILQGLFAVAENGAIWLTQQQMLDRALPFICENLILIINRENIVATLHEAYAFLSESDHQYGTFIAGPSKTADIEQSLVLGAHGPKTLTVFIVKEK